MSVVEDLRAARALIADREAWTKGDYARDGDGHPLVNGWETGAVCFCAVGALEAVVKAPVSDADSGNHPAYEALSACTPMGGVESFNDAVSTSHADVVAAYDRAIERAEAAA